MEKKDINPRIATKSIVKEKPEKTPSGENLDFRLEDPKDEILQLMPVLHKLRSIKQSVDTAPTYTPQSYLDQFVFYENSGVARLYLHIAGTWYYVALI